MSGSPPVLVALEVITSGAVAEVAVNDVPAATVGLPGGAGRAFIPLPAYVVRGANVLSARLARAGESTAAETKVTLRVSVFEDGDMYFTDAGRELVREEWSGAGGQQTVTRSFSADFGPPQWAWSACRAWDSPSQALADASPFVRELSRAYLAADADWIDRHSAPKFADMARAFPQVPEVEMRRLASEQLMSNLRSPPTLPHTPLPVLHAHGRLIALQTPTGGPYFSTGDEDGDAEFLIGKIGQEWWIVR